MSAIETPSSAALGRSTWMPYCGLPVESDESTSTAPGTRRSFSITRLGELFSFVISGPPIMYWTSPR